MDWPKVKTVMIVFLLIINLLIGAFYWQRNLQDARLESEMAVNAVEALKRLGVTVERELLEKKGVSIYTMEVERDTELEKNTFSKLLGVVTEKDLGSGNIQLTGVNGRVELKPDGIFQLAFDHPGRFAVSGSGTAAAQDLFKKIGVSAEEDPLTSVVTADGYSVEGIQAIGGKKVFNRSYTLQLDDQGLYGMQGGRILGKPLVCDSTPSTSIVTALFAFVDEMNRRATPCKEILDAELGYFAERSAPGFTQIKPVWRIDSAVGTYYIDAITLEFRRELPK